jgi:hypothetical protein
MQTARIALKSASLLVVISLCATRTSYAQANSPTAQTPFPAGSALISIGRNSDDSVTMADEYKQPKNVIEQEKPEFWTWYTDIGYESEYNFRGTNLTPGANGAGFFNARVTKWNFTLGMFGIHQFGHAKFPSWAASEGGGSAGAAGGDAGTVLGIPVPYTRFPTTTQTSFNELDVFLSYKFTLGPIDLTLGNIGFFIDRRATTFEKDVLPPGLFVWGIPFKPPNGSRVRTVGPNPTVEDEQFDRFYITLSTTKISKYITPSITYYQTVYSQGDQPTEDGTLFYAPVRSDGFLLRPSNPRPFNERNEALGGYLEGRINGHVPITSWADFNPYGIISVSFRDRIEPGGSWPYGSHPLTGWNHAQVGVEVPIHLAHLGGFSGSRWAPPDANLYLVPSGAYSYHIANPPPGTDRNEWWGGARFEVTF